LAGDEKIPYPVAKRIVDKLFSWLLLVVLSPVVLLVLAAFAVDMLISPVDRGSVFYGEPRVSKGRTFELLKFRTLHKDALADLYGAGSHARLLEADASNLTWTGRRILKPWYLDEVPQLLNVLRGDISLVGPRPWPSDMVERQVAEGLTYRNEIMAGLTGPAQVTKGSGRSFADLDLEYVERAKHLGSWALVRYDLKILLRTLAVMARGEGLNY
jgi:lipopolysaccharide/colanic/teichoic acid biosynthesis glycosyltransferase